MGTADDLETAEKPQSAKDWNGPGDDGNPQNWPLVKKLYHTFIPTSIAFLCPFGSSVYTPGDKQVMAEFGVSREIALLPFVFYLLGLSFGPVLAAPASETFGRKIVYIAALPVFAAFTIGAGFSNNITALIFCRFFAGLFSSPGLSIGTGTISDIWPPEKRGAPMATFITSVQMGPALGPCIGGFVVNHRGWRWTQWTILFGLVIVLATTLGMSETYKKSILKARAKKLGIEGPPEPERSAMETLKFFATKTVVRPMHMLFTEPIVTAFDVVSKQRV